MRHFLLFITLIFCGLLFAVFSKNQSENDLAAKAVVRVYGPSSFVSRWGAGPAIKEAFEKSCNCRVEWLDSGDINLLLQRLRLEGSQVGADLVLGLDQYDLDKAGQQFEWKKMEIQAPSWVPEISSYAQRFNFMAYDWGVMSFVVRKSENSTMPKSLEDFLAVGFAGKISLPDPRTSSLGLEFLLWLIQVKGEEAAFNFLKKLEPQILAYSPNWSASYGLFSRGQAKATFSYTTSPVYHLVEEKNSDVVAVELKEQHPIQLEYFGMPVTCKNCELGQKLAEFILSAEGQKIIMERNYMLPVIPGLKAGTPFESIPQFTVLSTNVIPGLPERERILKRWSDLRKTK